MLLKIVVLKYHWRVASFKVKNGTSYGQTLHITSESCKLGLLN